MDDPMADVVWGEPGDLAVSGAEPELDERGVALPPCELQEHLACLRSSSAWPVESSKSASEGRRPSRGLRTGLTYGDIGVSSGRGSLSGRS